VGDDHTDSTRKLFASGGNLNAVKCGRSGVFDEPGDYFGQGGFSGPVFADVRCGGRIQDDTEVVEYDGVWFSGDGDALELHHRVFAKTATPIPPAIAAPVTPSVPVGAVDNCSMVVNNPMVPEAAHGWPCASAPPRALIFAGSRPNCWQTASTWAA